MTSRTGVWIGIDVGSVRVGVARSDPAAIMAIPVTTLRRDLHADSDIAELAELVGEYGAVGVVVGLPRTLAGREGSSAQMARAYAALIADVITPKPVHFVDERLTTSTAAARLAEAGRNTKKSRAVIDQAAAVVLLQHWLDSGS